MEDSEKLRSLIPHWIDHNHEHADEYLKWAEKVGVISEHIKEAAKALDRVNWALKQGLDELGGPIELDHPPHHHHHNH